MRCPCLKDLPPPPQGKIGWPWNEESSAIVEDPAGGTLPKVSIVTPSFNQGNYIEETIRSVLLQGYPDIEYYIMDGDSSDHTVEIIKKYEPWITAWVSEKDNGQASAINKGWRQATGEIISYLNSDDIFLPNALSQVSNFFSGHPKSGMVYGDAYFVDHKGRILGQFMGKKFDRNSLFYRTSNIGQPATFMKRSVLEKTGYLDEQLHFSMDFHLWLRISLYNSLDYIPAVFATMRLHPGAKTVEDFQLFYRDELKSLELVFSRDDIPDNLQLIQNTAYSYCYLRGGYRSFQLGNQKEARCLLLTALRMHPRFLLNPLHVVITVMTFLPPRVVKSIYQAKTKLLKRKNFIELLSDSVE
jgi:glycosyltransferase involved in cell wall biosynthesis